VRDSSNTSARVEIKRTWSVTFGDRSPPDPPPGRTGIFLYVNAMFDRQVGADAVPHVRSAAFPAWGSFPESNGGGAISQKTRPMPDLNARQRLPWRICLSDLTQAESRTKLQLYQNNGGANESANASYYRVCSVAFRCRRKLRGERRLCPLRCRMCSLVCSAVCDEKHHSVHRKLSSEALSPMTVPRRQLLAPIQTAFY
jgi:hypothetical protein